MLITMASHIVTKVSQDLICVEMLDAGTKPHAGLCVSAMPKSRNKIREKSQKFTFDITKHRNNIFLLLPEDKATGLINRKF